MATTKIELYNGATLVATKTSAPFTSIDWTPANGEVGAAALTYKRYEDGGATPVFTSEAINGTVNAAAGFEYVDWEQEVSSTDLGQGTLRTNLQAQDPVNAYNHGAYASKALNGNGAIEFYAPPTTEVAGQTLGIANTYSGIAANGIDNQPLLVMINNAITPVKVRVYEFGALKQNTEAYTSGDLLGITLEGTTGKVTKNGVVIYTSPLTLTLPQTPIATFITRASYPGVSEITNAKFTVPANITTSPL